MTMTSVAFPYNLMHVHFSLDRQGRFTEACFDLDIEPHIGVTTPSPCLTLLQDGLGVPAISYEIRPEPPVRKLWVDLTGKVYGELENTYDVTLLTFDEQAIRGEAVAELKQWAFNECDLTPDTSIWVKASDIKGNQIAQAVLQEADALAAGQLNDWGVTQSLDNKTLLAPINQLACYLRLNASQDESRTPTPYLAPYENIHGKHSYFWKSLKDVLQKPSIGTVFKTDLKLHNFIHETDLSMDSIGEAVFQRDALKRVDLSVHHCDFSTHWAYERDEVGRRLQNNKDSILHALRWVDWEECGPAGKRVESLMKLHDEAERYSFETRHLERLILG